MAYVPNNAAIFCAAMAGCLGAMAGSDRVPTNPDLDVDPTVNLAFIFSEAYDTAWGVTSPTSFEIAATTAICDSTWGARTLPPQFNSAGARIIATPAAYIAWAQTLVDTVRAGQAELTAAGIVPPTPAAVVSGRPVTNYGAVGYAPGTPIVDMIDSTPFIQACINVGPGAVSFPPLADGSPAQYKVTGRLVCTHDNTDFLGYGKNVSQILQTGPVLSGGHVTGAYNIFEIPAGAPGYVKRNITFNKLGFVGTNNPFFQTILAEQGAWAAIRVFEAGSYSTDVAVTECGFSNLFFNLWRTDGNGKRLTFQYNVGSECGGEVNPSWADSTISNNVLNYVWAIEATNQNVLVNFNILTNCNTGISLGGSGGFTVYDRSDINGTITGTTGLDVSPIVVTTSAVNAKLFPGQAITIEGVAGNTATNIDGFVGTYLDGGGLPTATHTNRFTLLAFGGSNTHGNGAYGGGGRIRFKGDFGVQCTGNVIDTTRGGAAISAGNPLVKCIIQSNHIRKVFGGNHGIQILSSVPYFSAWGREFLIDSNAIDLMAGHGLYINSGGSHSITNNRIGTNSVIGSYDTGIGCLLQNGTGDVDGLIIRNNTVQGDSADWLITGIANVVFTGNKGLLNIDNTYGAVTSFIEYQDTPEGTLVASGTVSLPNVAVASPMIGSESLGLPFAMGEATVAMPDATYALTPAQYTRPMIEFTGVLTGQHDAQVPLRTGAFFFATNSCTGGNVRIIDAAGTGGGAVIPPGKTALVTCKSTGWKLGPIN